MNRLAFYFAAIIALAAFAAGLYLAIAARSGSDAPAIKGLLWPDPPRLTTFELTRDDGRRLSEQDLAGRWTLVFFGFANCPDVCPTTMNTLNQVVRQLSDDPVLASKLQVVFVSVDPERDNPEMLRNYVEYFNEAFIGATGSDEQLAQFAAQFGVLYMKVPAADGNGYTMDHSASVLLVDPALNYVGIFSQPHEVEDIVLRLTQMVDFLGPPS